VTAPRLLAAFALAISLLASRSVCAEAGADAKATAGEALIALRILAYDKNLAERVPGEEISIVVVSGASSEARRERALWVAAFALMPKVKVGGRAVRVHEVEFGDPQTFDAAIARRRPAAVIMLTDLVAETEAVCRVTRARKALTFSQRESAVRSGVAVGIVPGEDKREIVISVTAAREEGARFDAGLLQLARLVDGAR
jgi:hypothetical protein